MIASRYEVLSCLGSGGMGIVFKARDRVLGEMVALKAARLSRPFDLRGLERFRSEVRLARKVRHPNVCAVHDYGEDGDTVFLSMEYVAGRDLKEILRERPTLPWEDAYAIVLQIADGLVAIHDAGIVHRDLKPGNVMVDGRGVVRVLDFGIARWEDGRQTTSVAGAPDYMAPEQVRGRALDGRTDVYCFACLIYEVFTGWPLFCADSPIGVMLKHLEEPPPLDGAGAARLPRSLVPVLARALAKEPKGRYGSSQEMREALREARSSLDRDTTDFVHSPGGGSVPSKAQIFPAWLLALGVVALAGVLASTLSQPSHPLPTAQLPSMTFAARAPKRSVAQTSTSTPLAPPATVLPPAPTTQPPTAWRAAPPSVPLPTLAPSGVTEPSSDVPTAHAASSTTSPPVPTTSTLSSAEFRMGALVDINEPGVIPPTCDACPRPRTPLIAEHPNVVQRLRGKEYLVLLVLVDENGRVLEVKPQRQVEFLGDAAVKAVRKWRYRPATKNGVAVKVWIGVGIRFDLDGQRAPVESEPPPGPFPP